MKTNTFNKIRNWAMMAALIAPALVQAQSEKISFLRPAYWRPYDQTGINVFEDRKIADTIPYTGLRIRFGAGFTQQFQSLKHENKMATDFAGSNKLYPLKNGFMTAQANLFTDVQLADGIRLNLTTYLSSRHHNEAWVKGGYIQFDKLPFKGKFWTNLMEVATIKVGHMEINYGDAHFRRPDGGHTLQSPFMEGNIMDAFATEIGGEVYLQKNGFFGMVGMTNGMIKGHVDSTYGNAIDANDKRKPSIYLKGGVDKQINDLVRVRASASYYHNGGTVGSGLTLYAGDRTGSNYQNVMEKVAYGSAKPAGTAVAFSGRFNPGFRSKIDAVMLNGFIKVAGFEAFGTFETAKGRSNTEAASRKANQFALEGIYRIGAAEKVYIGARYNTVKAELAKSGNITYTNDVKIDRLAFGAGWFVTKNILLKGEIVNQQYKDFPVADYRAGGKFKGLVVEAVVGF